MTNQICSMKLSSIIENKLPIDARVYHVAYLWAGGFVESGLVNPHDAREVGHNSYLPGTQEERRAGGIDGATSWMAQQFQPQAAFIDFLIEDVSDEIWIQQLKWQLSAFLEGPKIGDNGNGNGWSPDLVLENIKIVDKASDDYMMLIKYIADVNLRQFYHANDWNKQGAEDMTKRGSFKIIKSLNS